MHGVVRTGFDLIGVDLDTEAVLALHAGKQCAVACGGIERRHLRPVDRGNELRRLGRAVPLLKPAHGTVASAGEDARRALHHLVCESAALQASALSPARAGGAVARCGGAASRSWHVVVPP